jgi:hypothetical protein
MPIWILVWSAAHTLFFFAAYRLQPFLTDWFFFACVCVRNIWRGVQAMFLNSCMIRRAPSFFFGRIQTLAFSDRPFILLRGYVSGAVKEALRQCLFQSMYNQPRTIKFFLIAFRLLPFLTDHFCSCVCVCQEHLKRRSGDAYLNTCMIRHTRSIFVLPHTDSCLCWPTIFVLACECVKGRWGGL